MESDKDILRYNQSSGEWYIDKDGGKIFLDKSGLIYRYDGAEVKPQKKIDEDKLKEATAVSFGLCKDLFDLFGVDITKEEIYENAKKELKQEDGLY